MSYNAFHNYKNNQQFNQQYTEQYKQPDQLQLQLNQQFRLLQQRIKQPVQQPVQQQPVQQQPVQQSVQQQPIQPIQPIEPIQPIQPIQPIEPNINNNFNSYKIIESNYLNSTQLLNIGLKLHKDKEYYKALPYFVNSAYLGNSKSSYYSGLYFYNGYNTIIDYYNAYKWFIYSISLPNPYSKSYFIIGNFYKNGIHFPENKEIAFNYYLKSANLGYNKAIQIVAECYLIGEGVDINTYQSIVWYTKLYNLENPDSIDILKDILDE